MKSKFGPRGCRHCGKRPEEGMGKKARNSGCCRQCYIKKFASDAEKAEIEREKQFLKENRVDVRKHVKSNPLPPELIARIQNTWSE